MKDSGITLAIGMLLGLGISIVLIIAPLCTEHRNLREAAVSAGVARFHPQTGKFEFIKSDISDKKSLTPVEDRL